ncbi:MAG TPA: ABC transporter permease [Ktedonobacterales bacterium]|nr:ABC transporter permease [Ktedonobacterales bacterium]
MKPTPASPASLDESQRSAPALAGGLSSDGQPSQASAVLSRLGRLARGLWRLATINRKVMIGSGIIAFFVLVALLGPLVIHQNPNKFTTNLMASPTAAHLLGTNQGGQDVFSQLVLGTRSSLSWAFLTGLLVVCISVSVGLIGGYFGGAVDDAFSLITNVFLVIPSLPLAIVAVQYFNRATITIALIVALTNWPWGARVLRAQTLSMRSREFVTAARAGGERSLRIIFFEIFPNELTIVAASFITTTIQVLLAVAGLEFLGFGDSTTISWGTMLYGAYNGGALLIGAWWWFVPPGLCIALLGSGLALLNFGIDEIADPRLRAFRPARRRWRFGAKKAVQS